VWWSCVPITITRLHDRVAPAAGRGYRRRYLPCRRARGIEHARACPRPQTSVTLVRIACPARSGSDVQTRRWHTPSACQARALLRLLWAVRGLHARSVRAASECGQASHNRCPDRDWLTVCTALDERNREPRSRRTRPVSLIGTARTRPWRSRGKRLP
jgi:hypothetical protein